MPGKTSKANLPEPGRVWNLDDIQELLDLLARKEITEFEMEQQGVKIRVCRGNAHAGNARSANGYVIAPGGLPAVRPAPPASVTPSPPPRPCASGRRDRRRIH